MAPINDEMIVAGITIIRLFSMLGASRCQRFDETAARQAASGGFHIVDRLTLVASFRPLATMT